MAAVFDLITKKIGPSFDDDVIDRLNYSYTSGFLTIVIIFVGAKQLVGEPIQCWVPPEYKALWEQYIESYCKSLLRSENNFEIFHILGFVQNTYFLQDSEDFPDDPKRKKAELHYYQWVSLFKNH